MLSNDIEQDTEIMENGPGQYEEMPERVHEPDAFFAVKQDTAV